MLYTYSHAIFLESLLADFVQNFHGILLFNLGEFLMWPNKQQNIIIFIAVKFQ